MFRRNNDLRSRTNRWRYCPSIPVESEWRSSRHITKLQLCGEQRRRGRPRFGTDHTKLGYALQRGEQPLPQREGEGELEGVLEPLGERAAEGDERAERGEQDGGGAPRFRPQRPDEGEGCGQTRPSPEGPPAAGADANGSSAGAAPAPPP